MDATPRQPRKNDPDDPGACRIRSNLDRVRSQIAEAAEAAGRDPSEVTLVAVTKYVGVEEAAHLVGAGCTDLGESRPQELWHKAAADELSGASWHLIGHLQRNKVDRTLPLVDLIHSVDSLRLLRAVEAAAAKQNRTVRVLLEVNVSGDASKHGFAPEEVESLGAQIADCPHVVVDGLMAMAAREGGTSTARENFGALRELRDRLQGNWPANGRLTHLSMGMSNDFPEAIEQGATIVRIGSALFEGLEQG